MINQTPAIITLRGHHIESLAERYANKNGFFIVEKGKSPTELELEKLVEQYKQNFGEAAYERFRAREKTREPLMGWEYGRRQAEKERIVDAFEESLLSNPNLEILVKNGPDSICQICPCNRDCLGAIDNRDSQSEEQDKLGLRAYGLEEGKKYIIKELTDKFNDYIVTTSFPSPRTKNGFGRSKWDKIRRDVSPNKN